MNIIVVLLMLFLGVTSSTGADVAEGPGEPTATTPPPPSDDPFPDDLGPLRGDRAIEQRFLARYPLEVCDLVDTGASMQPGPGAYDCLQEAVDAGEGVELVIATLRPGGDQTCRPSENIAEEPCA